MTQYLHRGTGIKYIRTDVGYGCWTYSDNISESNASQLHLASWFIAALL